MATIIGTTGNDFLQGPVIFGIDTMIGGLGNDTYIVDNVGDVVVENPGEGTDTVIALVSYSLAALPNVENLTLKGVDNGISGGVSGTGINATGNAGDNVLTGNGFNNVLDGGAGNDSLDGGGGADTMLGGLGDDTYRVDNVGDVVVENPGEGTDTVNALVSYSLAANVENLRLIGGASINATGNAADNVLTGNIGDNVLDGGAGNDSLDGAFGADTMQGGLGNDSLDGGFGADTMLGGLGDDGYRVDNVGDVVIENPGEGTDSVMASFSYSLTANVENLTLVGTGSINATGNAENNVLTGFLGNNVLDGGAGADAMIGGAGNDVYVVDNAADVVIEGLNGGTDRVQSSVSYVLSDNLENLTLTAAGIVGTGNALANDMVAAGAADTLQGGAGNDIYHVVASNDVVVENPNEGADLIRTVANYTLPANVENLILEAANLTCNGNELNNVLQGTSGNDTLDGAGGIDTVNYATASAGVTVNLGIIGAQDTTAAGIDTLVNIENLGGTRFDDILIGNRSSNIITAGDGNDFVDGGAGSDWVTYAASTAAVRVDLGAAGAISAIGQGLDTLVSIENVIGGSFNDVLIGSNAANTLLGSAGNDTLLGLGGRDVLSGGAGADRFDYNAIGNSAPGLALRDIISDFSSAQHDHIDLSDIDANVTLPDAQAFTFIGAAPFTGAGQVRFEGGLVQANVDAALGVDFEIQLLGVVTLAPTDFVL